MKNKRSSLQERISAIKKQLPGDDALVFEFTLRGGTNAAALFLDGATDKTLLSEEIFRPLMGLNGLKDAESLQEMKDGSALTLLKKQILLAESEILPENEELVWRILDGETVLLFEGISGAISVCAKKVPVRSITEPPTDVNVKGPRAGFVEDIKTNLSLVRMRLKTKNLLFSPLTLGKQSRTKVSLVYLKDIADEKRVKAILERLNQVKIDNIADSSYVAKMLSDKPFSLFKRFGTTEKPDVFCSQILEGRVGILVDGSPIAITLPYVALQDFQTAEDYFVNPYRASATRILRLLALLLAVYLPAFYVSAQLFEVQLIPISLVFHIASDVQGIPLSPSIEIALVLFVFEVLNEASIRMPKYVGYALSIVGALVLGDAVVSAGIVSTTAIIIIALSGICLYTVPNLYETTSILRWAMLFVAGSVGLYGLVVSTAILFLALATDESLSVPLFSPLSPLSAPEWKDSFFRFPLLTLTHRPQTFGAKNKRRIKNG